MARSQSNDGAQPASSNLSPQFRERLAELGQSDWPGTRAGASAPELWTQLFARWGRRVSLIDRYQLEASAREVTTEGLSQDDRDRLTAHVLKGQSPGWTAPSPSREPIIVVPYDPDWPLRFRRWQRRIQTALGESSRRVEHVGSTSVPGLDAKPVIDIQVSVSRFDDEDSYAPQLAGLEVPLHSRDIWHRFFCPAPREPRTVQIHVCPPGSARERDHLLFRGYLLAHPNVLEEYAALKRELARHWRHDRAAYTDAKSGFMLDAVEAAEAWAKETGWSAALG